MNWKQYKTGFIPSGSRSYRCGECNRVYTLNPTQHGYPEEARLLAICMFVEGSSYGSIGRILKVNPQCVANSVSQHTAKLPKTPMPAKVKKAELDELSTFVGKKKNEIYILTLVELCFELGCGLGEVFRSHASLSGTSATSQAALQRCFSCL